jgi:VIT1/CCC1 family predicted Fe2+/Mn2+ transporter
MSDNIEREVEEILRKLDKFVPEESRLTRARRRLGQAISDLSHSLLARFSRISLGQVMLASLILVVVAFLFRSASPTLARWAIIGGLILFFCVFGLSLISGRSRYERRWRGQVIDLSEPSLGSRLRHWLQRRSRGR